MDYALSTHLIVGHRLTSVWFEKIWSAGIPAIEIFCARQHFDYLDVAQVRELGHWFRDSPLKLRSLHSPMYNDEMWGRSGPQAIVDITEPEKRRRIISVDDVKRAIDVADLIPFSYLIQHLGVTGQEYDERRIDAAFTSLEELTVFARQRGVEIILENTPNGLATAERLALFNLQTHLHLNFCFDVGHAHMNGSVANEWSIMRDRVRAVHVHDNNGTEDQHLFPLTPGGSVDWRMTMDLLRSKQDKFPLLLELREGPDMANPIAAARETLQRLDELPAPEQHN